MVCAVMVSIIFVVDWSKKNVAAFSSKGGECITTFGKSGDKEGEFKNPSWGVCVDNDGFVYVVDTGNNRVQVF